MITYKHGNIFDSTMQCLVNPVNTVGVMGKGLALDFKQRYPAMFSSYVHLCNSKQLVVGNPHLWHDSFGFKVLLFPTKEHWRDPSQVRYIEDGLRVVSQAGLEDIIDSIAFPAIGCGFGGLDFETQVRPLLDKYLEDLPIDVEVYIGRGHGRR